MQYYVSMLVHAFLPLQRPEELKLTQLLHLLMTQKHFYFPQKFMKIAVCSAFIMWEYSLCE